MPQHLPVGKLEQAEIVLYCLEADEMWSYVGAKDCPVWLWLAVERRTGLVVGFHIGERNQESALGLWLSIPPALREKALVFTDDLAAYAAVFQKGQHQTEGKKQTTKIERLNNTLRQRCSRLVRKTLSFSKSWQNHFEAIRFLLVNLNLQKLANKPSLL
ncbi:IS1 family transposase [Adhaeribacter rhizoryzae]|uniref:IS1 family transposase n=1 Tax=Adhaeribacter rhizoryzae TaxID=2607907 RepID=A0A5M6DLB4_9BACT|nr:IS1 family transposase [Adhaeribacter rhizoryzae]KAA5548334.1 IS1 family transposase [Adhaeribacter rhizoryzae]